MAKSAEVLKSARQWVAGLAGGAFAILQDTFEHFHRADAAQAAAGLAYYTVFSLFPLLLALIAVGGFFLESGRVQHEVVRAVTRVVPVSQELIQSNVERVLERRGTVGLLGLLGLLWAGTGVFTVLVNHINRAWADAKPRGLVRRRILGLGIGLLGMLAALLLISLLSTPVLSLLARLELPLVGEVAIFNTRMWTLLTSVLPVMVSFSMFFTLYRWVPNTDVTWSEAVWGALFVAIVWEGAKRGFAWYVRSDLVRYQLVYGSLGAVVALLLWTYVSSWLVLFGAHLSAAIARGRRSAPVD